MRTLGYTWSLSVEEQFYLLWPILLLSMLWLGLTRRRVLQIVGAGIVAIVALRIVLYELHRGPDKAANVLQLYIGLHTRADALLVGCLAGLLTAWNLLPRSRRFLAWLRSAAPAAAIALAYFVCRSGLDHSQFYHGMFTLVAALVAVIIVRFTMAAAPLGSRFLESAPLVGFGRISYSMYLFHMPIIHWLRPTGTPWTNPWTTLAAFGLTCSAALACFVGVERPCLRWKHRLRPPAGAAGIGMAGGAETPPTAPREPRAAA
jgi:peptidoglycan/LPS O-acetylase OafA/YrhL